MMLKQIAERPGGVTAQTVRASNTGRSKDEFVPPYVGEGMSVNLGGDKYLSQLGLPTDQFGELFAKGPTPLGTVKRTGQKLLSTMSPYVKGPLETVTGQSMFTGRPIEESYQYPTKSVLLNQFLHNTPGARALTTARKLENYEQKGIGTTALNLGTGIQVTSVPGGIARQQRLAESRMIMEMAREHPNIGVSTDIYQKKDPKTGQPMPIDAETEKLLRAYGHLKKISADEAKKRKKEQHLLSP
jgi:hypothetical protein